MYSRTARLSVNDRDQNDYTKLRNFADTIFYNPMYESIVAQLKERPGFVQKSHTLIDTTTQALLVTQIVFANKEHFDAYADDPSTKNLWEYMLQLAKDEGIDAEVTDSDRILTY